MTGCASTNPLTRTTATTPAAEQATHITGPDCANWKPIYYSASHDTPDVIRHAIENNVARAAACPAK